MRVFLVALSSFWDKLPEIKKKLEDLGHEAMYDETMGFGPVFVHGDLNKIL